MPKVSRSALVPYPAELMFGLVNDIERYPEFLPWCADAEVKSRSDEAVVATLEIRRAGLSHRFTTRNVLAPPEQVVLELVDGPFEYFSGVWEFKPLAADACKVALDLEFEYAGRLLRAALAPVFNRSVDVLVDAFCARARELGETPA